MNFALVVVGYNRIDSLFRLINSLKRAEYLGQNVSLIVSVDYSSVQEDIIHKLSTFDWDKGEFRIIKRSENLGLRKHIISCGNLTSEFDAVVILEDDLIVSPGFYCFCTEAVNYYKDCDDIAGVSLYSPTINEMVELPFTPELTGFDSYLLKSAQSWGQCWTRKQWSDFIAWYESVKSPLSLDVDMPDKIYSWPESSWKKYFMKYIVEKNKYFVYPYLSFSTNVSEVGVHNKVLNAAYQVPLQMAIKPMRFAPIEKSARYDVFFENERLSYIEEQSGEQFSICSDIYGSKRSSFQCEYFLSVRTLPFKVVNTFSLSIRPPEENYKLNMKGNTLYLYKVPLGATFNLKPYRLSNLKADLVRYHIITPWYLNLYHGFLGFGQYIFTKIFK